jgi:hypothetical protein
MQLRDPTPFMFQECSTVVGFWYFSTGIDVLIPLLVARGVEFLLLQFSVAAVQKIPPPGSFWSRTAVSIRTWSAVFRVTFFKIFPPMADRLYCTMAYCCLVIGTNCHEWLSYMFGKWYGRVVCCAGVESASNQPVFNASHGTGRFIVVDWRLWWLWIATCLTNIIYLLCNNLTMFIENDWRRRQLTLLHPHDYTTINRHPPSTLQFNHVAELCFHGSWRFLSHLGMKSVLVDCYLFLWAFHPSRAALSLRRLAHFSWDRSPPFRRL